MRTTKKESHFICSFFFILQRSVMTFLISRGLETVINCQRFISSYAYSKDESTNLLLAPILLQRSLQNSQSTSPTDLRYLLRDSQSEYKNK